MELGWGYLLLGFLPFFAGAVLLGIVALRMLLAMRGLKRLVATRSQGTTPSPPMTFGLLTIGFGNIAVGLISQQWGWGTFLTGAFHVLTSALNFAQIALGATLLIVTLMKSERDASTR
ncbi:MAG: hypothetical protein K1X64_19145 [Myxococcaceae bacterium]|nr:hypothetical protein [Myxococcaceae bacterium]